jgi:site-specific recombinase XerD
MEEKLLTAQDLEHFARRLREEEKSPVTVEKYVRDAGAFADFVQGRAVTKELTMAYKQRLIEKGYAVGSVNSMLASLNSFLRFLGWEDCRVRQLRTQKKIYSQPEQELTKSEYQRLVAAASGRPRLGLILQTICCTGIRVSELRYFTVEQVRQGEVTVSCKNKTRVILLPAKLKKKLLSYARQRGIEAGVVFRTRSGRPVDRSNIWSDMKSLCEKAQVAATKVFPHNLRKLFARTFYELDKDVAKLADILGHSSINTTRIYLMSTGKEHRKKIERLGLLL